MAGREEMSTSFGSAAGAYEAGRPDYPRPAVDWMLAPISRPDRAMRVIDVGAGTGKLTRTLVEAGAEVVAVDPDAAMLATLRQRVHGVPTFHGTAERLALPDASADAVVLGQAWHWVDVTAASTEIGRVLRSGGVLGLVWNIRDESVPWIAELTRTMHGSHAEELLSGAGPRVAAPFAGLEDRTWRWSRSLRRGAFLDLVASRSYVITASEPERADILTRVGELFDANRRRDDSGDVVDVPYLTRAYRGIRP